MSAETPADWPSPEASAEDFTRLLDVEKLEENFFLGANRPGERGRAFGGQVIGQALMAANNTVDPAQRAHSLHAYFMRPGDATKPVLYRVERDRTGRSFATRRVIAIQSGQPILNMAASFHFPEEGLHHQVPMPDVPAPEDLPTELELAAAHEADLPERYLAFLRSPRPIEMRPCSLRPPFKDAERVPQANVWIRARGRLGDAPALHAAGLAFSSDMGLLTVAMIPHGKAFSDPDMQFASLDHALWLHDDFRMDDWLLYAMDSPWSGGARGFSRGRIYARDGRLVADVAQEGLVRQITPRG